MPLLDRFSSPISAPALLRALLEHALLEGEDEPCQELEARLAARLGRSRARLFPSGRAALREALRPLSGGPPGELIMAALNYPPLIGVARRLGLRPVFVDVREEDLALDPEAAREAWTPRTRALLLTHAYGIPGPAEALRRLADERGIVLIEDCAQAFGARAFEPTIGAHGHLALYSFGPTKPLPCLGGGALVGDEGAGEEGAFPARPATELARELSLRLPRALLLAALTRIPGSRPGPIPERWLSDRAPCAPLGSWHRAPLGALERGYLRARLEEASPLLEARRAHVRRLLRELPGDLRPRMSPDGYSLLVEVEDAAAAAMALRREGIDACAGELSDVSGGRCPRAARLAERLLRLPSALPALGATLACLRPCPSPKGGSSTSSTHRVNFSNQPPTGPSGGGPRTPWATLIAPSATFSGAPPSRSRQSSH